tara:strand:- start:31184 stop:31507 length:324 start_codon:yes stop_codon:yes gene_type:complete
VEPIYYEIVTYNGEILILITLILSICSVGVYRNGQKAFGLAALVASLLLSIVWLSSYFSLPAFQPNDGTDFRQIKLDNVRSFLLYVLMLVSVSFIAIGVWARGPLNK